MTTDEKENNPIDLHLSLPKDLCTEAGFMFRRQQKTIFNFFFFAIDLATFMDEAQFIAAEALAKVEKKKYIAEFEKIQKNKKPTFKKLQSFGEHQSDVICIRLVDNFLSFVSEVIQACAFKKPEILRSSEHVKIEDVLQFSKKSDLIGFLVDKKLNELSFGGIWEIEKFLERRTGDVLVNDKNNKHIVSLAIALRNLYTHNRGIVDSVFLDRTKLVKLKKPPVLGKRLHADFDLIVEISNALFDSGCALDKTLSSKFKIRTKRYETWLKNKKKGS